MPGSGMVPMGNPGMPTPGGMVPVGNGMMGSQPGMAPPGMMGNGMGGQQQQPSVSQGRQAGLGAATGRAGHDPSCRCASLNTQPAMQ